MSTSDAELARMVRGFRISDLCTLLNYAGRNKDGKKSELLRRALDLLKLRSAAISVKIRELHQNRSKPSRGNNETVSIQPLAPTRETNLAPTRETNPAPTRQTNRMIPFSLQQPLIPPRVPVYLQNVSNLIQVPTSSYPLVYSYHSNPNVRFKNLPFYDILDQLLSPTNIIPLTDERFPEMRFTFSLSHQQVLDLRSGMPDVQVQLRICVLDTSCAQDDEIPLSICIKVNGIVCNLPRVILTNRPGQEPRRPKVPLDITSYIKKSTEPNEVVVSYASSESKQYAMGIFFVLKQNWSTLLQRLKSTGVTSPRVTMDVIKEKLGQDSNSDIAATSLKGTLVCPLSKKKMVLPCRASTCTHLQCFDAAQYLQMNELKPKWICPVCDKPAFFPELVIDGLFLEIIVKAPIQCNEVEFQEDGTWTPIMPNESMSKIEGAVPESSVDATVPKRPAEVVTLDSDSDTEDCLIMSSPECGNKDLENAIKKFDADAFSPETVKSNPPPELLPHEQGESTFEMLPPSTIMLDRQPDRFPPEAPTLMHRF